jgi:hypothetical protein
MVVTDAKLATPEAKPAPATRAAAAREAAQPVAPLITLGTPLGRWPVLASELLAQATDAELLHSSFCDWHSAQFGDALDRLTPPETPSPTPAQLHALQALWPAAPTLAGGMDERGCWALDTLRQALPQARYLVLVESPVSTLAAWMQAPTEGTVGDALAFWHAGAQRLLGHIQRNPERCLVVSADEAARAPAAFAERVGQWLGIELAANAADINPPIDDDAIAAALADAAVRRRPAVAALFQHLHACCVPLVDGADVLGIDSFGSPDIDAAVQTLAESRQCCERLLSEDEQLRSELQGTRQKLQPALLARQQASEKAAAAARQLAEARKEAATLQAELAALKQSPTGTAALLAEARQESELLLLQLHQVQEELEHYYLEYRKLQERGGAAVPRTPVPSDAFSIGQLQIDGERDTPPHRELSLSLRQLAIGDRRFASLQLRLVEHVGRPGIAIFAPPGADRPLSAWQDSGSEDGRPYLLFVPTDPNSRAFWQRLPRTDWAFLAALPPMIEQAIGSAGNAYTGWAQLARRLAQQFDELPPRLRYDDIEISAEATGFALRFVAVQFGHRQFDHVDLRWQPGRSVDLILPTDSNAIPPLSNWPLTADGAHQTAWRIPVGKDLSRRDQAQRWSELSQGDRAFVLALLDALPAGPARLDPEKLAGGADARQQLIKHAAAPLRSALDTVQGGRIRRILRRLANAPLMPL